MVKSLRYCRQLVALYNNEQLALLEQSMAAWSVGKDAGVQAQLAADIREACRQLELLSTFLGSDALRHARDLKKTCLLLLMESGKVTDATGATEAKVSNEVREAGMQAGACQVGASGSSRLSLLTEFYRQISHLCNATASLSY